MNSFEKWNEVADIFWISMFCFSCGALILDVVLKFSLEVAEDETISTIQTAIFGGKLRNLSVNASYITGIPPVEQTSTAAPTSTTPKSNGLFLSDCYWMWDYISVLEVVIHLPVAVLSLSVLSFQTLWMIIFIATQLTVKTPQYLKRIITTAVRVHCFLVRGSWLLF